MHASHLHYSKKKSKFNMRILHTNLHTLSHNQHYTRTAYDECACVMNVAVYVISCIKLPKGSAEGTTLREVDSFGAHAIVNWKC